VRGGSILSAFSQLSPLGCLGLDPSPSSGARGSRPAPACVADTRHRQQGDKQGIFCNCRAKGLLLRTAMPSNSTPSSREPRASAAPLALKAVTSSAAAARGTAAAAAAAATSRGGLPRASRGRFPPAALSSTASPPGAPALITAGCPESMVAIGRRERWSERRPRAHPRRLTAGVGAKAAAAASSARSARRSGRAAIPRRLGTVPERANSLQMKRGPSRPTASARCRVRSSNACTSDADTCSAGVCGSVQAYAHRPFRLGTSKSTSPSLGGRTF